MFKYLVKNLKSLLTKQGVISLLLVLNIIVSALVICFSFGIYYNFNTKVEEGEITEKAIDLSILPFEDESMKPHPLARNLTLGEFLTFFNELPQEIFNDAEGITLFCSFETDLYKGVNGGPGYNDNAYFITKNSDGNIVPVEGTFQADYFDINDYVNGKKVVALSEMFFHKDTQGSFVYPGYEMYYDGATMSLDKDETHTIINGEKFEIIHRITLGEIVTGNFLIPITALDDSSSLSDSTIQIQFRNPVTKRQYDIVKETVESTIGNKVIIAEIEFAEVSELQYYKTVIIISVLIAILSAVNMAILYRYILEKRSSDLSILRICGCSKLKAVGMYLAECMIINIPLFALTELFYHKLLVKRLGKVFIDFEKAYTTKLYSIILAIFVAVSLVVMLTMIAITISKSSIAESTKSAKVRKRFGVMKVFEIIQISVVLVISISITSSILSRYDRYAAFKNDLSREGYVISAEAPYLYLSEYMRDFSDCELMTIEFDNFNVYDTTYGVIAYDDEYLKRCNYDFADGVWLTETDVSYEKDNVIPVVLTYTELYDVGDRLTYEIDTGSEILTITAQVVGILDDGEYVAGIKSNKYNELYTDFRYLYTAYGKDLNANSLMLMKSSDHLKAYKTEGMASGIQFIFTDNLYEDDAISVGEEAIRLGAIPLSEIKKNSLSYIYEQMYTLFPIALCIFILTVISTVSISAIYTKRQLRNYAIFYICGARWRTCALKSLKDSAITCAVASALCALLLFIGKQSLLKETVISFGIWHAVVCLGVIALYLLLSMIMPIAIIGSSEPKDVLKEE